MLAACCALRSIRPEELHHSLARPGMSMDQLLMVISGQGNCLPSDKILRSLLLKGGEYKGHKEVVMGAR